MTLTFAASLKAGQKQLATNDPVMAALIKAYGNCQLRPHGNFYSELFDSIVGQQLSVKAAASIMGRIREHYGSQHPEPEKVIATETEILRGLGLSNAKVAYVKDLAQHVMDGRLDLDHIATLDDEVVIEQLTAVKGIGEWTAHMFMMFSLGRLNVLAWGDLGIRKAAQVNYGLSELATKDELIGLSKTKRWEPYQTIACWYLWKSLDNTPNM